MYRAGMATEIIIEMAEDATPQDETLVACIVSLLPGVSMVRRHPGREEADPNWKPLQ